MKRLRLLSVLTVALLAACDGFNGKTSQVSGEVFYLQKIALPEDAVLTVRLDDVSKIDAPAQNLATQTIRLKGAQQPFAFTLAYNPGQLREGHVYAVSARIEDGSGLRFLNTEQHSLLLTGEPVNLRLKLDMAPAGRAGLAISPDFLCRGNEPFWNLELKQDQLRLSRLVSEIEEKTYSGAFTRFSALDGGAGYLWEGETRKGRNSSLIVEIAEEHCEDSMAGPEEGGEFDYSVVMDVDGEKLQGCCHLLLAQDLVGEQAYTCEDGSKLSAQFASAVHGGQLKLVLQSGREIRLTQQLSASGARFVGGDTEFWEKGGQARLVLDGAAAINCQRSESAVP